MKERGPTTVFSLEYFVYPDPIKHHGINNKIEQTIIALKNKGHNASKVTAANNTKELLYFIKKIALTKADIIIFRNTFLMPILLPSIICARIRGKKAILDLPTPITNVLEEFKTRKNMSIFFKMTRIIIVTLTYPWVFLPFNKILQYAPESAYFSLFSRNKIVRIANGININAFPKKKDNEWPENTLTLIGVANMASWHGFDRIINGLAEYYSNTKKQTLMVKFIIVGEGQNKQKWEELSNKLGITQYISFVGFKKDNELNKLFDHSNIAVSSLGLFRIKITEASVLKSREYAARGIPFITTGSDLDFSPCPSFLYKVQNHNEHINIENLIIWYTELMKTTNLSTKIRKYASAKLDFSVKINDFIIIDEEPKNGKHV